MFDALGRFLNKIFDVMGTLAMGGFSMRTIPDDVPYKEIEPYSYQCYACELAYMYVVTLSEGGPVLTPFWDQNGKQCVEDTDGTIYRIKDS